MGAAVETMCVSTFRVEGKSGFRFELRGRGGSGKFTLWAPEGAYEPGTKYVMTLTAKEKRDD